MRQSTELTLSVPWGHVSAVSWGSPKNRPVLVVHGNQDNAGAFTRLIQLLPDTYHYVAIDLPGHGLSSHFPPGMFLDFFNFVLAIHYVLDALNWEKCLYLGHSFGGQIGVMYCIFYPGRIEKMITIDALMAEGFTPPEAFERLKIIHKSTLLAFEKKDERLYTGEQVLDALMNRRRFKLTREAAEALMVRAVTRVGDKYKYNRDIRMKIHVGLCFSDEQNFEFFKHLRTPVLFLLAKDSWFGLVKKLHLAEKYKELFTEFLTMVTIEGNHDVHNNIPENVAPHVIAWFDDGAKSKL
ncbi:serine hydrolase-like protein [Diachasma alloeum]|uniref:serine hydrolase-like protein n=1 Tax=Diachasma alloeum TaxID=454923 RepID=UPI0007384646|nr:serine hydrolase-like protein [Diachasma alloeum]